MKTIKIISFICIMSLPLFSGQIAANELILTNAPADGSSANAGQVFSSVTAKNNYDTGDQCGQDVYFTTSGACTAVDLKDEGGAFACNDAQVSANVTMNAGGTTACLFNFRACDNGDCQSWVTRRVKINQVISWTTLPSGSYKIGYGSQDVIAKSTTTDSVSTLATIDNTLLTFTSLTPTICTTTQWGSVVGIEAGTCTIQASVAGTDDWVAVTATKSWTYYWADTDGDGVFDKTDNCRDVSNAGQADTDGNGIGDACNNDRDPDGDEREYGYDNCATVNNPAQTDTDGSGVGDACNQHLDSDGDEWENTRDNCPNTSNPGQQNTFGSPTLGDACEIDNDADGILDGNDNCLGVANPDQADSNGDGVGNACAVDNDGDGVDNKLDNCLNQKNTNQLDSNSNAIGDVCELDSDLDGIKDDSGAQLDNCPLIANADQADTDNNGIGDVCEMTFVKPVASGTGDCLSWANACASLQQAINVADSTGRSQIFMAKGIYPVSSTLTLKPGLYLVGGFVGVATETRATQADPVTNVTVVSADYMGDDTVVNSEVGSVSAKVGNNNLPQLFSATNLGTTVDVKVTLSGITLNAAGNSTLVDGSALLVDNSLVELVNARVVASQSLAGAVRVQAGGQLTVRGSTLTNNSATNGAAISADGANTQLRVIFSTISSNTATTQGGALMVANAAKATIESSTLRLNSAVSGGAIVTKTNTVNMDVKGSLLEQNIASTNGGAVLVELGNTISFDQVQFVGNAADQGAGIYASSGATSTAKLAVTRSLFDSNKAANNGGALATQYGTSVTVSNTTFAFNKAGVDAVGSVIGNANVRGGAIYSGSGSVPVSVTYSTLVSNEAYSANYGGGAIAINNDATTKITLHGNLIAGNYASNAANGSNILRASGTDNGIAKIINSGYNLVGFNNVSGVVPANLMDLTTTTSFVSTKATLDEIVETTLRRNGGDGYISPFNMLPIIGGGPGRDAIPAASCTATADARGEKRPDKKSGNACDIGAYEYTVLSCQEDAQRRYNQGELFVKACLPQTQNLEVKMGTWNLFGLLMLAMLALIRRPQVSVAG